MILTRGVIVVIAALLAAAGSFVLLPRQVGGSTTYVITNGVSMQPDIRTGDLVLVRPANRYDVGDVIAYRSSELGTTVLHRILERDGDRFVTKGDSNSWVDAERPRQGEVLGRMWLHVPGGGKLLGSLRNPRVLGAIAALTFLGLAGGRMRRRTTQRRNRPERRTVKMEIPGTPMAWRQAAAACAVAAVASAGASVVAWTTPGQRVESDTAEYTHHGAFAYQASVAGALAYDDGTVDTGEPVFVRLVPSVSVTFSYRGDGVPAETSGRISMVADLRGSGGWQRTIELAAQRPFAGPRADVGARVDLGHLNTLGDEIDQQTGTSAGGRTVTFRPSVVFDGDSDTTAAFHPSVAFRLDDVAFRPTEVDEGHRIGTPLLINEAGSVSLSRKAANHVTILGRAIPVKPARAATTALAVLAALAAGAAGVASERARRRSTVPGIAERHANRIVRADRVDATPGPTVDVADFETLAQLAEHGDHLIVHVARDDHYYVHGDNTRYRFRACNAAASAVGVREDSVAPDGPPGRSATLRAVRLLGTLGAQWRIVRHPALADFAVDAVASGPGGVLAIAAVALEEGSEVGSRPAEPVVDRLRHGVKRLEGALARRQPGLPGIVPAVVFWTERPMHANAVTVDAGVLLLDGDCADEWLGALRDRHISDQSAAAMADAVGDLADRARL